MHKFTGIGYQGFTGFQGDRGPQGLDGAFGGQTFIYKFSNTVNDQDPGEGYFHLDNSYLPSVDFIYLDTSSNDTTVKNVNSFLTTVKSITSSTKGFLKLTDEDNDTYVLYQITNVVNNNGWWKLSITNSKSLFYFTFF